MLFLCSLVSVSCRENANNESQLCIIKYNTMANTRASKKAVTTQNSTFENESEKLMGIETIGDIKRVKLTDGRIAEVRKLKGKDVIRTRKMMSVLKDQEDIDFETLNMTVATTIDGAELPYEDYLEMPQVDFALITAMHSSINF